MYAVKEPVNTRTVPTINPGKLKGNTTLKNDFNLFAPRLSAASNKSLSIFSITPTNEIIIKGKNIYTVPTIIAPSVYKRDNGSFIIFNFISKVFIIPLFPNMLIQANERTTEFVNIGKTVNAINNPLNFLDTLDM